MKNIISTIIKTFCTLLLLSIITQVNANANLVVTDSVSISGKVMYVTGEPMEGVELTLSFGGMSTTIVTDAAGNYLLENIPIGSGVSIDIHKDADLTTGLSMLDMLHLRDWLLQINNDFHPYNILAMDMNNSGALTTYDLVLISKLILGIETTNGGWRFISAYTQFPNPSNPWSAAFPSPIPPGAIQTDLTNIDFVGYKLGDMDQSVDPNE